MTHYHWRYRQQIRHFLAGNFYSVPPALGDEAMKIYQGFELNAESKVEKQFDKHTTGTINITYERYVFNTTR